MVISMEVFKEFDLIIANAKLAEDLDWLFNTTNDYEDVPLVASNMSRIASYVRSNTPFGFITAFRKNLSCGENISMNKELALKLRKNGCGFTKITGEWNEGCGEDSKHVKESTLFVVGKSFVSDYDGFKNMLEEFRNNYDQDVFIAGKCLKSDDRYLKKHNMINTDKDPLTRDNYIIEIIGRNNEILETFTSYTFKTNAEINELIKLGLYMGHAKIDNKNFQLKAAIYRPSSNFLAGNALMNKYENATGLLI
jgi:hypothetical protein